MSYPIIAGIIAGRAAIIIGLIGLLHKPLHLTNNKIAQFIFASCFVLAPVGMVIAGFPENQFLHGVLCAVTLIILIFLFIKLVIQD